MVNYSTMGILMQMEIHFVSYSMMAMSRQRD
jgi:hypothetical protein